MEDTNTLYRKYRPKKFADVLGQKEVVEVLEKSIKNNNLAHAYLFSGDRGTGKTSVARIFAQEIGSSPDDIFELDAASNRGIAEIREIREMVNIKPISSKYKVYIIDEVHMLTKDAFNALLKTLEEPPTYVIFILATTEKEKVLPTIISRCQVFDFKNPSKEVIQELLQKVVLEEKREIDQESLEKIAFEARGSFRDSLSILQKVLSVISGKIEIKKLEKIFGESSPELENEFLEKLAKKDKEAVFETYFKLKKNNFNLDLFLNNLIEKTRNSLLLKNSKFFAENTEVKEKEFLLNLDLNSLTLKKFLELKEKIYNSTEKEIAFEIFLLDFFE